MKRSHCAWPPVVQSFREEKKIHTKNLQKSIKKTFTMNFNSIILIKFKNFEKFDVFIIIINVKCEKI